MQFSAIHKLSTYLMALSALAALLLSPDISLPTTAATMVAVGLSWFAEPNRFRLERYTAAWNIATVLFFFYLVTDLVRGGLVILAGAHFLLFVLCNKLFNRRTSRDYLQTCVVSFLLLVVATTVNTGLSYAIAFAAYVVFATWTLILLHLRREMEENYLLKHSEGARSEKVEVERVLSSRRVVGAPFLLGTSLLSLGVVFCSAAIFVLFPRIGFGVFLGHKRGGITIAGFQERVELGQHGLVRDNPSVVMRVVFPSNRNPGPLRWRGSAFDTYRGGVWSHSQEITGRTQTVAARDSLFVLNHAPGLTLDASPRELRGALLRQEIYLEPLDSSVLFAADRPVAIEAPRGSSPRPGLLLPRRGPLGEIRTGALRSAGFHYVAYSSVKAPSPALLARARPLDDPNLRAFLQLPPELPARIGELARQITRGRTSLYEKVRAVELHLRANYRYSLRLTHTPGLEPVDEFLFVTRRGHCEYFASAMVLLLRSLGIHARNVNGFAGGSWNHYGQYLAIRQGDAHSWVEVLFPNLGWVTFDPTPPSSNRPAATGVLASLEEMMDAMRMRWYRHVIEYDLRQQVSFLREAHRWLAAGRGRPGKRTTATWIAVAVVLASAVALLLWRRWRGQRTGELGEARGKLGQLPAVSQLYARMLKLLARAGLAKAPGKTPQEFTLELRRRDFPRLDLVERLTGWYYLARFRGGPGVSAEAEREMNTLLRELQRALRPR